jgi:peptide/nickel transport system substrate-binding protein
MKKRILWLGVSFLLVAALVLASCGPTEPGEQEEEEEEEEEEEGGPHYGGTLTVSHMRADKSLGSLDPIRGGSWWANTYCQPYLMHLTKGDVSMGMTGTKEHNFNGRYIPSNYLTGEIAESWELVEDPLSIVWHIRPGIYWQEKPGVMERRELTAEDVATSVEYRRTSKALGGDIPWVTKAVATDKYTCTLELNEFFPEWMFWLGFGPWSLVIPAELLEVDILDWTNAPCAGPYALTNYVTHAFCEYTRNPEFYDTTTIDGKEYELPFTDKLVWPIIKEVPTQLAALRTGKYDIWERCPWMYKDTLASTNPELRVWEIDGWASYTLFIRQDIGAPYDDLMVRQALNMAIDKQKIIDDLYGGYGELLNFPFPKGWGEALYTPLEKLPEEAQMLFEYDPVRAKELLTLAGYPDGFKTEAITVSETLGIDIMSLVKDYWMDNLNVEVEILPRDEASCGNIVSSGGHVMYGLYDDSGSPFFAIGDFLGGGAGTELRWTDPYMMETYEKYVKEYDVDQQNAYMKAMAAHAIEQTPMIVLPSYNHFRYAWPWVMNYEGESNSTYLGSIHIHQQIWIDEDMKAEMGY